MRTSAAAPGLALVKARSWSCVALVARAVASSLAVLATSCSLFLLLASLSFSATSSCTRLELGHRKRLAHGPEWRWWPGLCLTPGSAGDLMQPLFLLASLSFSAISSCVSHKAGCWPIKCSYPVAGRNTKCAVKRRVGVRTSWGCSENIDVHTWASDISASMPASLSSFCCLESWKRVMRCVMMSRSI